MTLITHFSGYGLCLEAIHQKLNMHLVWKWIFNLEENSVAVIRECFAWNLNYFLLLFFKTENESIFFCAAHPWIHRTLKANKHTHKVWWSGEKKTLNIKPFPHSIVLVCACCCGGWKTCSLRKNYNKSIWISFTLQSIQSVQQKSIMLFGRRGELSLLLSTNIFKAFSIAIKGRKKTVEWEEMENGGSSNKKISQYQI